MGHTEDRNVQATDRLAAPPVMPYLFVTASRCSSPDSSYCEREFSLVRAYSVFGAALGTMRSVVDAEDPEAELACMPAMAASLSCEAP